MAVTIKAIKENPKLILTIPSPSINQITAAFENGGEWFKEVIVDESCMAKHMIQKQAVLTNPQLIRWCLQPSITTLAVAINADPSLIWVAKAEKKEKDVISLIKMLKEKK